MSTEQRARFSQTFALLETLERESLAHLEADAPSRASGEWGARDDASHLDADGAGPEPTPSPVRSAERNPVPLGAPEPLPAADTLTLHVPKRRRAAPLLWVAACVGLGAAALFVVRLVDAAPLDALASLTDLSAVQPAPGAALEAPPQVDPVSAVPDDASASAEHPNTSDRTPAPDEAPRPPAVQAPEREASPSDSAEATPSADVIAAPAGPSREEVIAFMSARREQVRACTTAVGIARVRVVFGADGRVLDAEAHGAFPEPRAADCMAQAVEAVRVAPFERERYVVEFPYRL